MKIPPDMRSGATHVTNSSGDLKIVKYHNNRNVTIEFIETGFILETQAVNIRRGTAKDYLRPSVCGVGFIGVGKFAASKKGEHTKEYNAWHAMLQRCYSKKVQEKQPTYKGCSVDLAWLNYQAFAAWYNKHYPTDGNKYELDKDIKVPGNKIYSPSTCMFVTPAVNNLHARRSSMKTFHVTSPLGEKHAGENQSEFCRLHGLGRGSFGAVLRGKLNHHKGWTLTDTTT